MGAWWSAWAWLAKVLVDGMYNSVAETLEKKPSMNSFRRTEGSVRDGFA